MTRLCDITTGYVIFTIAAIEWWINALNPTQWKDGAR